MEAERRDGNGACGRWLHDVNHFPLKFEGFQGSLDTGIIENQLFVSTISGVTNSNLVWII